MERAAVHEDARAVGIDEILRARHRAYAAKKGQVRLRELGRSGRIGSVNHRHISFMGSITAPGRLVKQTAPEAARLLAADGVDAALLVPV